MGTETGECPNVSTNGLKEYCFVWTPSGKCDIQKSKKKIIRFFIKKYEFQLLKYWNSLEKIYLNYNSIIEKKFSMFFLFYFQQNFTYNFQFFSISNFLDCQFLFFFNCEFPIVSFLFNFQFFQFSISNFSNFQFFNFSISNFFNFQFFQFSLLFVNLHYFFNLQLFQFGICWSNFRILAKKFCFVKISIFLINVFDKSYISWPKMYILYEKFDFYNLFLLKTGNLKKKCKIFNFL